MVCGVVGTGNNEMFTMADNAENEQKLVVKSEIEENEGTETSGAVSFQPEGQFMPYNVNMEHWLMEKLYRQNEIYLRSLSAAAAAVASATVSSSNSSSPPPYNSAQLPGQISLTTPATEQNLKGSTEDTRLNSSILQILANPPHNTSQQTLDSLVPSNSLSDKRRKELSLKQKVDMIQTSNGKSQRQLADEFNVCKSQVHNIMKRKDEILETFEYSTPSNRKRRFIRTENEEINILTLQYYLKMKELDVNVTGSMLQRKAREVAQQLGKTEFKASNGWLESFRKRHKIGSCYSGTNGAEKLPSFPSFANIIKKQCSNLETSQSQQNISDNTSTTGQDHPLMNGADEQNLLNQQLHLQNGYSLQQVVYVCESICLFKILLYITFVHVHV